MGKCGSTTNTGQFSPVTENSIEVSQNDELTIESSLESIQEIANKIETLYFKMFVTPASAERGLNDMDESYGLYFGGEVLG